LIQLHDFTLSGNAHKVRNMLSLLAVEHELVPVDLLSGEQRGAEFLALNPFGQVPVLIDGDTVVRDSCAILVYLARKFGRGDWLPVDAEGEAEVHQWLATASTAVADGPAFARLIEIFGADGDIAEARVRAHSVLAKFEQHLERHRYLALERPTIADVASYSYVAMAPDGGVSLEAYPNVRAWLERIEQLPGFVAVPVRPAAAA